MLEEAKARLAQKRPANRSEGVCASAKDCAVILCAFGAERGLAEFFFAAPPCKLQGWYRCTPR